MNMKPYINFVNKTTRMFKTYTIDLYDLIKTEIICQSKPVPRESLIDFQREYLLLTRKQKSRLASLATRLNSLSQESDMVALIKAETNPKNLPPYLQPTPKNPNINPQRYWFCMAIYLTQVPGLYKVTSIVEIEATKILEHNWLHMFVKYKVQTILFTTYSAFETDFLMYLTINPTVKTETIHMILELNKIPYLDMERFLTWWIVHTQTNKHLTFSKEELTYYSTICDKWSMTEPLEMLIPSYREAYDLHGFPDSWVKELMNLP